MNAKELIKYMTDNGLTETEIAKRSKTVRQATINRISNGNISDSKYSTWEAINAVYEEFINSPDQAKDAA